jgi:uncharacterized membrane protein/protein-disulfide isomerase
MRNADSISIIRLLALPALAISGGLLMEYVHPAPDFCGFGSCEDVLQSPYGRPLGIPLPVLGLVVFTALIGFSLSDRLVTGRLFASLALVTGAGGLALIALQVFVLRQVCPFCLMVDLLAVTIAVLVLLRRKKPLPVTPLRARILWLSGVMGAAVVGMAAGAVASYGFHQQTRVPSEIMAYWVPDKVTVVEVADFQCPRCRLMHAVVNRFLHERGDRIHFVRLTVPMPAHDQARNASKAFLCAEQQGKGDEMAERLFEADNLSPESCAQLAGSLGLSMAAYRTCVADPKLDERLDADLAWVKAVSPQGLPVVWVQDRLLAGVQPISELRRAADAAASALGRRAAGRR